MLEKYNCIPFFYPKPPAKFYKNYGIHLAQNESIFCSIEQLVKMAKNIDKYTAIGEDEGLIKGKQNSFFVFIILMFTREIDSK